MPKIKMLGSKKKAITKHYPTASRVCIKQEYWITPLLNQQQSLTTTESQPSYFAPSFFFVRNSFGKVLFPYYRQKPSFQ